MRPVLDQKEHKANVKLRIFVFHLIQNWTHLQVRFPNVFGFMFMQYVPTLKILSTKLHEKIVEKIKQFVVYKIMLFLEVIITLKIT